MNFEIQAHRTIKIALLSYQLFSDCYPIDYRQAKRLMLQFATCKFSVTIFKLDVSYNSIDEKNPRTKRAANVRRKPAVYDHQQYTESAQQTIILSDIMSKEEIMQLSCSAYFIYAKVQWSEVPLIFFGW